MLLHQSAKCSTSSTIPVPLVQQIKSKEQLSDEKDSWVQSPLDQKMYEASNPEELLQLLGEEKFNPRSAANFVSVLSKWVEQGKLEASQYQQNSNKSKLEDSLCGKSFQMKTYGILQVYRVSVPVVKKWKK